jgi:hypothetical protein
MVHCRARRCSHDRTMHIDDSTVRTKTGRVENPWPRRISQPTMPREFRIVTIVDDGNEIARERDGGHERGGGGDLPPPLPPVDTGTKRIEAAAESQSTPLPQPQRGARADRTVRTAASPSDPTPAAMAGVARPSLRSAPTSYPGRVLRAVVCWFETPFDQARRRSGRPGSRPRTRGTGARVTGAGSGSTHPGVPRPSAGLAQASSPHRFDGSSRPRRRRGGSAP